MKCELCGNSFNDGVQCGSCKKHLDFGCALISEVGWRKLGADRRAAWKCTSCKGLSPIPSPVSVSDSAPLVTLETLLKEIQSLKLQLRGLPALIADIKSIKEEMSDLRASCEFANSKTQELSIKFSALEARVSDVEQKEARVNTLQADLDFYKSQCALGEQRSRLNNVEIKGVPTRKDENLFTIIEAIGRKINYTLPKTQIDYLYRIPIQNTKEKSIIVRFTNRYVKEDFVAAARAYKTLSAAEIGFQSSQQRVFVNDHLTAESKKLLTKTKALAKEKGVNYVWVKFGKIHIRKNDTSQIHIIAKDSDLNKLV